MIELYMYIRIELNPCKKINNLNRLMTMQNLNYMIRDTKEISVLELYFSLKHYAYLVNYFDFNQVN